jgi:hypothetical protein
LRWADNLSSALLAVNTLCPSKTTPSTEITKANIAEVPKEGAEPPIAKAMAAPTILEPIPPSRAATNIPAL